MEPVWDKERIEIFEPMPFKGDEITNNIKGKAVLDTDDSQE
jgi:hypothetical protein